MQANKTYPGATYSIAQIQHHMFYQTMGPQHLIKIIENHYTSVFVQYLLNYNLFVFISHRLLIKWIIISKDCRNSIIQTIPNCIITNFVGFDVLFKTAILIKPGFYKIELTYWDHLSHSFSYKGHLWFPIIAGKLCLQ